MLLGSKSIFLKHFHRFIRLQILIKRLCFFRVLCILDDAERIHDRIVRFRRRFIGDFHLFEISASVL